MADCHKAFLQFNDNLNLSTTWFNRLKSAQRSIKKQLHDYFDELPGFSINRIRSQGSKKLFTLIRKQSGTVDFDCGIYFFPKPTVSASELMQFVYRALYGLRTTTEPELKDNCVQVTYADGSRIHVDVPIYYLTRLSGELNPYLATQHGWVRSSPYEFDKWYEQRRTKQLTRIIRYLKAWCDNQGVYGKMPKGVALTVLAATYYCQHQRDDVSFMQTLTNMQQALTAKWQCKMPVAPYDNLLKSLSGADKKVFLSRLDALITQGQQAITTTRKLTALSIWKKQFGLYFSE